MIPNFQNYSNKNIGSFFLSPAHGKGGTRATIKNTIYPPKNFRAKPKQAGKKKKGSGGNKFLPACSAARSAAVGREAAAHSASAEGQSRKFFFLKGRIKKEMVRAKYNEKNFLLCSPSGERRRWAGLPPAGRQLVSVGVLLIEGSNLFQQTPPKTISRLARRFAPRFGGHFGKVIPRFFERNGERARRKAAVHKRSLYCGEAARADGFSFAFGESQNEILLNCRSKALLFSKIKNF